MCMLAIDDRSKVMSGVQTLLEKAGADIHALGLINIHEEPDIEKQSDDDDIDRCPLEFTRVAKRRDDVQKLNMKLRDIKEVTKKKEKQKQANRKAALEQRNFVLSPI